MSKAKGAVCSKCGRRTFLAKGQIEEGFICPRCGFVNKPDRGEKKVAEETEEDKDIHVECPVCRLDCVIPKEKRFKLLCKCPHCDSMFIKPKKLPEKGEKPSDEAASGATKTGAEAPQDAAKAPDEKTKPSVEAGDAKKPESETKDEKKDAEAAKDSSKPEGEGAAKDAGAPAAPAAPAEPPKTPPTPEQRRILSDLFIAGEPESMEHAAEVISTVYGIAEDAINESYLGFRFLSQYSKTPLLKGLISSPVFRKVYFDNESASFEDISLLVEIEFEKDIELRNALRVNVDDSLFGVVCSYIDGYAAAKHKVLLEDSEARILALKTFYRGFGAKLRPGGQGGSAYGRNGAAWKSAVRPSKAELEAAFKLQTPENAALDRMLVELGFVEPPKLEEGCLLFACFLIGAPSLVACLFF